MEAPEVPVNSAIRLDEPSEYLIKKARISKNGAENLEKAKKSTTVYVGNLSFYTSEEQIYELFSKCGEIERIIMGLDRFHHTPCGFCFVEFRRRAGTLAAVKYLNDTKLGRKSLQIDLDPGFVEGRQYGRGASGGQVMDEFRTEYDPLRGGLNPNAVARATGDVYERRPEYGARGFRGRRRFARGRYRGRGDRGDRGGDRGGRDWGDRGDRGDREKREDREDRGERKREYPEKREMEGEEGFPPAPPPVENQDEDAVDEN